MIRVASPQQLPALWMCKRCVFLWSKLLMRVQLGNDNDRGTSLWTLQHVWPFPLQKYWICKPAYTGWDHILPSTSSPSKLSDLQSQVCNPLQQSAGTAGWRLSSSMPWWHTSGSRSCKPCLGHPVTNVHIWHLESASSHTELNSQAVKLPATPWARPVSNKVKLV